MVESSKVSILPLYAVCRVIHSEKDQSSPIPSAGMFTSLTLKVSLHITVTIIALKRSTKLWHGSNGEHIVKKPTPRWAIQYIQYSESVSHRLCSHSTGTKIPTLEYHWISLVIIGIRNNGSWYNWSNHVDRQSKVPKWTSGRFESEPLTQPTQPLSFPRTTAAQGI